MLTEAIEAALKKSSHLPGLSEVMKYAVLPAGKLFRPRLVEAMTLDLNQELTANFLHLATAIELHHAYTLIHDDLPAMDNDLVRRGKPATHVAFGEWKAILAGDALLIASIQELALLNHKNAWEIHRLMTWATGAKGLIEGQFRDLSADGKLDFSHVLRIHELKTGRLIQLATLGPYLLTSEQTFRNKVEFLRLGREIGVSFQLLDDLSELLAPDVSDHEKTINPFISSLESALNELRLSHLRLTAITFKHRLVHVEEMLMDYFRMNQKNLLSDFSQLEKSIPGDLSYLKMWITNFV
jgi:geranylgeranyl pyrophosphate synthase